MTPQPGTAGTDDDPLDSIATDQLVVNGEVINNLVGLAFDSASATDGVLRFDGTGSTSGITDGSAKVIVGGTVYDVAGGEWVDFSGTSHSLDSWEKVINSQFDVSITGVSPDPVKPGNTLDVTVDVTNNGTDQDTQTVTLSIDNSVGQVDSASVTLSGGGSTTQTLSWAVPSNQTKQDYQASVASADDSASQTVTVGSPTIVYDFETGDTSRWDTASDLSATSGSPPFNSGSFIGTTNTGSSTVATVIPATISGGSQISTFEFYWREIESTSTGGGIRLRNSNGDVELSTLTDNPAWVAETGNGITQVNDGNGNYNDWTRFTVTFDWGAGTFDIDFKNLNTGLQETQSGFSLIHAVDIEELEVSNYSSGSFSPGSNIDMEFDDIRVVP